MFSPYLVFSRERAPILIETRWYKGGIKTSSEELMAKKCDSLWKLTGPLGSSSAFTTHVQIIDRYRVYDTTTEMAKFNYVQQIMCY